MLRQSKRQAFVAPSVTPLPSYYPPKEGSSSFNTVGAFPLVGFLRGGYGVIQRSYLSAPFFQSDMPLSRPSPASHQANSPAGLFRCPPLQATASKVLSVGVAALLTLGFSTALAAPKKGAAPDVQLSPSGRQLAGKYEATLASLKEEITKALPAVAEAKKAFLSKAAETAKV